MNENSSHIICFGGEAHESWTDAGLCVSYTNQVPVVAARSGDGSLRALPCPPAHTGDVKAEYNESAKSRELAEALNQGSVSPLSAAYFRASSEACESIAACGGDLAGLPRFLCRNLQGGPESIALAETLRQLLDDAGMEWDDALHLLSRCYCLKGDACLAVPLAAVEAIQPRCARLIHAVNEKLCGRLWDAFPGDWARIASGAVLVDGEVRMARLCAALCGNVVCSKHQRAGELRTLYSLMPGKFEEL